MKFTWDERKRKKTLTERGLDFADAKMVFEGATFTFEDDRFDYGERRLVTLGLLGADVVVIVHTELEKEIRVISMRKGEKDEQETYFENV
jgi:uncharacterized DUF497 family protein